MNTITTYDSLTVSHILIIGTAYEPNAPAAPAEAAAQFEFNGITKTFLIINSDETRNTPKYTDVTIEEYLNLYYIEHFSLNIIEFSDLYKKYKNNTEEVPGVGGVAGEEPEGEVGVEEVGGEEAPGVGEEGGQGGQRDAEEPGVAAPVGRVAPEGGGEGGEGRVGGGGGTEMTGKKKTVKKIKKNKK